MDFDRLIGQVQHRTRLGTKDEAIKATRATLSTLGSRLAGGAPGNLAAQLPEEVGHYLLEGDSQVESFSLDDFYRRVAAEEGIDLPESRWHALAVIGVLRDAVGDDTLDHARAQLPEEWSPLFEEAVR